jgi:hypothetical protein
MSTAKAFFKRRLDEPVDAEQLDFERKLGRLFKTVGIYLAIGPLVAGTIMLGADLAEDVYERYSPFAWFAIAYYFGLPYGLLVSIPIGWLVAFAGKTRLWTTCLIALLPLAISYGCFEVGSARHLNLGAGFWSFATLLIVASNTICWFLARRWCRPAP